MILSEKKLVSTRTDQPVYIFTLRSANGTVVKLSNYGAIITSFIVPGKEGSPVDIVLGFENIEDYWSADYLAGYPWFGAAVGRYANRIKDAAINIHNTPYQLSRNNGNNQLHGGHEGFDKKVWTLIAYGEDPCAFVTLQYRSRDGEEGFPGNLDVQIRFELSPAGELSYAYTATTDAITPVNLCHHDYFNLNGKGTVLDHAIKINAADMLVQADDLVATGEVAAVSDTAFDFREFHPIRERIANAGEYDKSYVVIPGNNTVVAEAKAAASGLKLIVTSSEPVVHFYAGKWIPSVTGKNGELYQAFSGFCLETHQHPNAVNIPAFPSSLLHPGEKYFHKTSYKIELIN